MISDVFVIMLLQDFIVFYPGFFSCCDIKFKITAIKVTGIMYSFEKDMNDNLCLAATNYIHRILQE